MTPDSPATQSRRDVLRLGTLMAAGAALTSVGGGASAAPVVATLPSTMPALRPLAPGAVDETGAWVLPKLGYDYAALEPHIDAKTMEIHHTKHHDAYVKGVIANEAKLAEARAAGDFALVEYWSLKASFNGGGHILHCIFWDCMGPNAGGEPTGALAEAIARDFGSFAAMKAQFSAAAKAVEGSGWGLLSYNFASGKLAVSQGKNQNLLTVWAEVPLLALDVWEHAYYLKYQNQRAAYVDAWWNVVDWNKVAARYALVAG